MGREERVWTLFVDESGDFSDGGARSIVAGLLVPETVPAFAWFRLEGALQAAVPEAPAPLHAWLLRRPAAYLVWHLAGVGADTTWHDRERAEFTKTRLDPAAQEACERARAAVARGREPDHGDLRKIESALRARPNVEWPYLRRRDVALGCMRELVGQFAREHGLAFFLSATTSRFAERASEETGRGDSYLALLSVLLERVAHALARLGGAHRVDLRVQRRDVEEPRLGRTVALQTRHLADAARRAVGTERRWRFADGQVRLNPGAVDGYFEPALHTAHRVVDLLAFHTRPLACGRNTPLESLEHAIRGWGVTPASGAPPLPHPAASGPAQQTVRAAIEGKEAGGEAQPVAERLPEARPWACEQAERWAAYFRQARGEGRR